MPGKNKFIRFWLPVYLYAIIIFIFSSISQPPVIFTFRHSDKFFHFIEYFIFGFLLIRAFKNSSFKLTALETRFLVVLIGFIYGITDEIHQYFVEGKVVATSDMIFDGIGALLGQFVLK